MFDSDSNEGLVSRVEPLLSRGPLLSESVRLSRTLLFPRAFRLSRHELSVFRAETIVGPLAFKSK